MLEAMTTTPLTTDELLGLEALLNRAVQHEQLQVGVKVNKRQEFYTAFLHSAESVFGGPTDMCLLRIKDRGLKALWVRRQGSRGGIAKAARRAQ